MDVGVAAILLSLVLATGCAERPTVQVDEPWVDRAAALYYVAPDDDCGSADPNVGPEMPELCNGIDDNCDGAVDEGVTSTFFRDGDGDTYGTGGEWVASCEAPAGFAANGADCNDGDAAVSPDAEEVCDHQDNDCDREVDEEVTTLFYADVDGDTFGDAANGALACTATAGRVADSTDCDDTRATVWPAAPELCDALDNDCDGAPGPDEVDADSDTELTCGGDCDDAEPLAWSGAIEETGDGVDNDCNGVVDADAPTCDSLVRHSSESVQAAIDAATEGDVICVAGGTYVESLDFGGAGVTVWGVHGPDTTFLDGGGVGRVVRFASAEGAGAVLTGFTVQNGAIDAGNGAGIEIVDASPTLNDLVVTANTASTVWDQRGAGISVEGGAPTFSHILVNGNRAYIVGSEGYRYGFGGGLSLVGDDSVLEAVTVAGNVAGRWGGGVYLEESGASVFGSDILDNGPVQAGGGGVYANGGAPNFENVRISGNESDEDYGYGSGGGVFLTASNATFANIVISENVSWGVFGSYAGGLLIEGDGAPAFVNVIVTGNTTQDDGGGVYVGSGTPTFRYGDLYGNTPDDVYGMDDPSGTDGNLSVDPTFYDAALHLSAASALVDAGAPSLLDPDGSISDLGLFGGPDAGDRDLDGDGYAAWWLPSAYDAATSPDADCDDSDASVFPGSGC